MSQHVFSREEAERLIPQIRFLFGQITLAQSKATEAVEALGGVKAAERAMKTERVKPGLEEPFERLRGATSEIVRCVETINEMGCLVKSLESGLVDFPFEHEGRIVYLCWQYGEAGITHWHETDTGFSDRKPLDGPDRPQLLH
jgi:hypothetical protein